MPGTLITSRRRVLAPEDSEVERAVGRETNAALLLRRHAGPVSIVAGLALGRTSTVVSAPSTRGSTRVPRAPLVHPRPAKSHVLLKVSASTIASNHSMKLRSDHREPPRASSSAPDRSCPAGSGLRVRPPRPDLRLADDRELDRRSAGSSSSKVETVTMSTTRCRRPRPDGHRRPRCRRDSRPRPDPCDQIDDDEHCPRAPSGSKNWVHQLVEVDDVCLHARQRHPQRLNRSVVRTAGACGEAYDCDDGNATGRDRAPD